MRSANVSLFLLVLCATTAHAQAVTAVDSVLPATQLEPAAEQIALIRTAAPEAIVDRASIWILGERGYELARGGSNGFGCLAQRGLAGRHRIPRCDDAHGVEALFPTFFLLEEMRAERRTVGEYRRALTDGYRTGRFRAPRYGGISYMYSTDAVFVTAEGDRAPFTPHVMIYWPYCSWKDLGVEHAGELRGMSLALLDMGSPECHLIVNTPPGTARTLVSTAGSS